MGRFFLIIHKVVKYLIKVFILTDNSPYTHIFFRKLNEVYLWGLFKDEKACQDMRSHQEVYRFFELTTGIQRVGPSLNAQLLMRLYT